MIGSIVTENVIVQILAGEMGLSQDPLNPQIWVRNQNKRIPPDDNRLFVTVGTISARPVGVTNETPPTADGMNEIQAVQVVEDIQIDLLSRDVSALVRRWEVALAMQSIAARQAMEANTFKISRNPVSVFNTSSAEGSSNINRYSITYRCFSWYKKEKVLNSPGYDYFDDFTTRADDAATIGTENPMAKFEITPDTPPPQE